MRFDYVIVGAGTSGCVIAGELSRKGYSVGLIEKGKGSFLKNFLNTFPNGTLFSLRSKYFTKEYECEASKGINFRKIKWPRGEIPGGSSVINGLVYMRGSENDFEYLIENNKKIDWKLIKQLYFENEKKLNIELSSPVSTKVKKNEIVQAFIKSLKNLNFSIYESFRDNDFSKSFIGGTYELNLKDKKRTSALEFLEKTKLSLIESTNVKNIIFDQNKAIGVTAEKGSKEVNIYCNKEVIISSGTINTPKILQLSGIGNQKHLESIGIKSLYNSSFVGENLRDHLQTKLFFEINSNQNFNNIIKNKIGLLKEIFKYFFFKKSLLDKGAIRAGAFCELIEKKYKYQINLLLSTGKNVSDLVSKNLRSKMFTNGITISVNHLNPKSVGSIKIKSNNFLEDPIINPNYLSDNKNQDIESHLNGIKKIREIIKTRPLSDIIIRESSESIDAKTDFQLIEFIKNNCTTIYHHTGTCKLGTKEDGVVDENFKVYGVDSLRICDASIFPDSVNGNTAASCYVLGKILAHIL